MRAPLSTALAVFIVTLLAGCAGSPMRSYDSEVKETVALVKAGSLDQALNHLEEQNKSFLSDSSADTAKGKDGKPKDKTVLDSVSGKDILYFFEKGEILGLKKDYAGSRDAWLRADEIVRTWEDEFKTNPTKLIGDIGSFVVSDRTRRYDGQDYEKVFLSARLTLDHILLGNFDHARIEMKKTYEREKLIESFREKEYDAIKESEKKQDVQTNVADLGKHGYPLAELDTPEVRSLKNGYQNAFAHYLAGYFFEARGEYSLAEPGYRNALALKPDSRHIKERLATVGRNKPGANEADVLFVVETGFAPSWKSVSIPLPIRLSGKWVATPLSFPVIKSENRGHLPASLTVAGRAVPIETLVDVDAMARRLLKDQLPGIMGRTVVRAVLKTVAQQQAQRRGGDVVGVLFSLASVLTEQADERAWRTLPDKLAVGRAILPRGQASVEFSTPAGPQRVSVNINNRLTVIPIRITDRAVFVGQPGKLAAEPEVPAEEPAATVETEVRTTKKPAVKRKMPVVPAGQ
jgi:hypothetical protein